MYLSISGGLTSVSHWPIQRFIPSSNAYQKSFEIPFTPHIFRHTHATELLRSGWDASYVQKRLGHKDIQTTINTYAHLNERDLKEAFNKFKQASTSAEQS